MDVFCDLAEIVARYGWCARDLNNLLVFHGLHCGSMEDFALLVAKLEASRAFRDDLSALTRQVRIHLHGRITDEELLTLIAFASGGQDLVEVGGSSLAVARTAGLLRMFLAGVCAGTEAGGAPTAVRELLPDQRSREIEHSSSHVRPDTSERDSPPRYRYASDAAASLEQEAPASPAWQIALAPGSTQSIAPAGVAFRHKFSSGETAVLPGWNEDLDAEGGPDRLTLNAMADVDHDTYDDEPVPAWLEDKSSHREDRSLIAGVNTEAGEAGPPWKHEDADAPRESAAAMAMSNVPQRAQSRSEEPIGAYEDGRASIKTCLASGSRVLLAAQATIRSHAVLTSFSGLLLVLAMLLAYSKGMVPKAGHPRFTAPSQTGVAEQTRRVELHAQAPALSDQSTPERSVATAGQSVPLRALASAQEQPGSSAIVAAPTSSIRPRRLEPAMLTAPADHRREAAAKAVGTAGAQHPVPPLAVTKLVEASRSRAAEHTERHDPEAPADFKKDGVTIVPQKAMGKKLVSSRKPVYPAQALAQHIEGHVVLNAFIAKDGTVRRVDVLRGEPVFIDSAVAAASWRRYRPYLLRGAPIEVQTEITMNYPAR